MYIVLVKSRVLFELTEKLSTEVGFAPMLQIEVGFCQVSSKTPCPQTKETLPWLRLSALSPTPSPRVSKC